MLRLGLAIGVGTATLLVSGLLTSMATAQTGADAGAIVSAYEMARNRRDIDTALTYFADDAIISQRSTSYAGKDEIRKYVDGISTRSRFVVVADRRTSGNRVTWTEQSSPQGQGQPMSLAQAQGSNGLLNGPNSSARPFVVTVEAVVQDGKIRSLSYFAANQPLRADPALDGRAQLPASVGLGAVVVVLFGALLVGSISVSRRGAAPSSLRGRLMHDLQGWSAARQQV